MQSSQQQQQTPYHTLTAENQKQQDAPSCKTSTTKEASNPSDKHHNLPPTIPPQPQPLPKLLIILLLLLARLHPSLAMISL